MVHVDSAQPDQGQSGALRCDLLVVGGGIMGLWAAYKAGKAGLSVVLADAGALGKGASNGHLGALMAHKPDGWNAKKQFQFDALLSLEGEVAALENLTGIQSGYRRSGRLMPLSKPIHREVALRHQADAARNWKSSDGDFEWRVIDTPPVDGWPLSDGFGEGFILDTFAARVAPRSMTGLLIAALRALKNVIICEGNAVAVIDASASRAKLSDGDTVGFGHCIVAAGYEAFPLLESLNPLGPRPLGKVVKGQSALMAVEIEPALPLIFLNGLYVVPHEGGKVAIGSTSENEFGDAFSTDGLLDDLIDHARSIVPALRDAPVIERWAGLRPKAVGRDPMVGPHPDYPNIHALAGGFKVSFGIAHRLADCVLAPIIGRPVEGLPDTFRFEAHLK